MQRIYRFGLFEVNTANRDLQRQGMKIRLQDQPLRVLLFLLERPGQIVTREQLRDNLWSSDIYVEFDSSLRVAVGKLRDALGDDADNPRFVETIPRQGYRFIAPVQATELDPADSEVAGDGAVHPKRHSGSTPIADTRAGIGPQRSLSAGWAISLGLALLVVVSLAVWSRYRHPSRALSDTDGTLISTFANYTGDAAFDGILKQALEVKLDESPFLNLVPDAKIRDTLGYMKLSPDAQLSLVVWREVCERTNAKAMLAGTIAPVGAEYLIGLEAIDCKTGDVLARDQVQAENKEGVLNALNHSSDSLRISLGESLRSVGQFDTPIQEATTSSLQALKSWNLGALAAKAGEERSGIPLLKHATELDPNFASAYNELGITYFNLGELQLARDNFQRAFDLRQHASERERFNIESRYYHFGIGDLDKAIAVLETWKRTYRKDAIPPGDMGVIYGDLGEYRQEIEESLEAIRRMPNNYPAYQHLASAYLGQNNLEQGFAAHQKELAMWDGSPFAHADLYAIAFVRGNGPAMEKEVVSAAGKPDRQEAVYTLQALAALSEGHLKRAASLFEQATAAAEKDKSPDQAAYAIALQAQMEAEFGEYGQAGKRANQAIAKSNDIGVAIVAATALARAGFLKPAETIAARLAQQYPQDTVMQKIMIPTISATVALGHDPGKALQVLEQTRPYEFGMLGSIVPLNISSPPVCPAYIRGLALLQNGDASGAAEQFQKILNHRGIYMVSPYYPLAYLGLARASVLQGDLRGASDAYDRFFLAWQNSDRDIPILREAKQEYAKLHP